MGNLTMDIFISSNMAELEQDRECVRETIEDMSFNSTMFELFPAMSESASEVYLEKVRECNIFILLLWKTFSKPVQDEYNQAVEKNKPILIFIKELKYREKRTDNLSKFIESLQKGESKTSIYKQYRELKSLRSMLKEAIGTEVSKFYELPRLTQTKQELYEMGETIMRKAYNRLYVFEKTPSLFLGSKGYTENDEYKLVYEKRYLNQLRQWIEKYRSEKNTTLLYIYSSEKTAAELEQYKDNLDYIKTVIENIKKYKKIENETGHRFKFLPVDTYISGPLIVGDINYAMWFLGDAVAISQRNERISNEIVNQLNRYHDRSVSIETMIKELSLDDVWSVNP